MKTWGLHKQSSLHTWGLRGTIRVLQKAWRSAMKFTLKIVRSIRM